MSSAKNRLSNQSKSIIIALLSGIAAFSLTIPYPARSMQNFDALQNSGTPFTQAIPTRIYFPKLDHHVVVSTAIVSGNNWQMFDDKASWVATSAPAGMGNTIIYAHNTKKLFGSLTQLKVGGRVQVEQGGKTLEFQISDTFPIAPNDIGAITTTDNQLTLYTCEGAFDQKRRIIYAQPVENKSEISNPKLETNSKQFEI